MTGTDLGGGTAARSGYVYDTCKLGQGPACCKYLVFGPAFNCAKLTSMRFTIDGRGDSMAAKGDNCDGMPFGLDLSGDCEAVAP
jgi:hypothetical protein